MAQNDSFVEDLERSPLKHPPSPTPFFPSPLPQDPHAVPSSPSSSRAVLSPTDAFTICLPLAAQQDEAPLLPLGAHREHFEAIRRDDAAGLEGLLGRAGEAGRWEMIHGRFQYFDVGSVPTLRPRRASFTRPLTLAAAFGSLGACAVLLAHGANALEIEPAGRQSVLHALVVQAFYEPRREGSMVETYRGLCAILPPPTLRRLLETENAEDFRPLEFTVQQGCLSLMEAIFNTPGVYLLRERHLNLTTYRYYDVTVYEAANAPRKSCSPPILLIGLNKRHARKAREMFRKGFLHDWIEGSLNVQAIPRTSGAVLYLMVVIALFLYEMDLDWVENAGGRSSIALNKNLTLLQNGNETFAYCEDYSHVRMPIGIRRALLGALVAYAVFGFLSGLYGQYLKRSGRGMNWMMREDLTGKVKEQMIAKGGVFDRTCESCFYSLLLVEVCLLPFVQSRSDLQAAVDAVRTLLTLVLIWGGLLHLQFAPVVGSAVVYIRELMGDLMVFAFIFTVSVALYTRHFVLFFSVNARGGCMEDFGSFQAATYSLYLAMLNMLDFTQYDVEDRPALFLNHFVYAILIGILLLNLLIAVFSNTMARVSDNKDVIVKLSRLVRYFEVQVLLANLPGLSWGYHYVTSRMLGRFFVVEDGRVLLVSKTARLRGTGAEGKEGRGAGEHRAR